MKKIMFNDRYGLTEAVLSGRKMQTRRVITCPQTFKGEWVAGFHVYKRMSDGAMLEWPSLYDADEATIDGGYILPKYKVGEIVAVAQSYKDAGVLFLPEEDDEFGCHNFPAYQTNGWTNKMFVHADLMPHQICITNVRVEKLHDISDEDCIKEGVVRWTKDRELFKYDLADGFEMFQWRDMPRTPREAYAALIDKISGKGTWERNPYVFVYGFEIVK